VVDRAGLDRLTCFDSSSIMDTIFVHLFYLGFTIYLVNLAKKKQVSSPSLTYLEQFAAFSHSYLPLSGLS